MNKRRNLAVGGLAIAGISYIAGVLTAPKSGKETRRDIRRAALKAKAESERKLKKAHSELNQLVAKATKLTEKSKDKASQELKAALTQAEVVRQKTRELLSAIHEGEAEDRDLQKAVDDVKKAIEHLKKYLAKASKA